VAPDMAVPIRRFYSEPLSILVRSRLGTISSYGLFADFSEGFFADFAADFGTESLLEEIGVFAY
jgi:hypothetical protein